MIGCTGNSLEECDLYFDLDWNFTPEELKKEFRRLSKLHHPDISHDDGKKFREIANEYELLRTGKLVPPRKVVRRKLAKWKFYEFFSLPQTTPIVMKLPKEAFEEGATIFLMEKIGGREIRVNLPEKSSWPSRAFFQYGKETISVLAQLEEYERV